MQQPFGIVHRRRRPKFLSCTMQKSFRKQISCGENTNFIAPQAKILSCTMQKPFRKRISCGTKPQNFRLRRRKFHARSSKPVPCKVQILQHRVAMCCKVQILVCAPLCCYKLPAIIIISRVAMYLAGNRYESYWRSSIKPL